MNAQGLSTADLDSLSEGLAAGRRITVYLREPVSSLGLEAGASARVIAVDGSTVTVRPKGVDDELPYEADELQMRRAPARAPSPKRRPAAKTVDTPAVTPATAETGPAKGPPSAAPAPRPTPVASKPVESKPAEPKPTQPAPAKPAVRRTKAPSAAVSVTITSAGARVWTVSVAHGAKRVGKPTQVSADRVASAMHALGDSASIAAVDAVIEAAREDAEKRIAELSQELEDAKAALASLSGE